MTIGIIDADLIGRQKHRFPNLVCEKISAYWNERGKKTQLLLSYDNLEEYDPGLTKEDWLSLLEDNDVFDKKASIWTK